MMEESGNSSTEKMLRNYKGNTMMESPRPLNVDIPSASMRGGLRSNHSNSMDIDEGTGTFRNRKKGVQKQVSNNVSFNPNSQRFLSAKN